MPIAWSKRKCEKCNQKLTETIEKIDPSGVFLRHSYSCNKCELPAGGYVKDTLEEKINQSIGTTVVYITRNILPNYYQFYQVNRQILLNEIDQLEYSAKHKGWNTKEAQKKKTIIATFLNNFYQSALQIINKIRDLFENDEWGQYLKNRGFSKQKLALIQASSGIRSVLDKYDMGDVRGGFTHGRDRRRLDSISHIEFQIKMKDASNKETLSLQILVKGKNIKKVVNEFSESVGPYLTEFEKQFHFVFKADLEYLTKLHEKHEKAKSYFESSGVHLTGKDITNFTMSDKMTKF